MELRPEKPTCLDFFAGSGLVAEGLKDFFNTIWANDVCAKKREIFCANHDGDVFIHDSIADIEGRRVPPATLSWGSFPCQDLSLAGNMGGLSSPRSGLVWHWLRIMDELPSHPPIAVAENVVGLVSADKGEHYRKLHNELVKRGYKVGAVMLDAVSWTPQSRKRIFVVAVRHGVDTSSLEADHPTWCHSDAIVRAAEGLKQWVWWDLPAPPPTRARIEDVIDFNAPCDDRLKQERLLNLLPEKHRSKLEAIPAHEKRAFTGYKRTRHGSQVLELRFDGVAGCLRTPGGGSSRQFVVIKEHGAYRTRLLTIREAAALMGAPAGYKIPGAYNDGYKAMGDAVAVPVARYLAQHLLHPLAMLAAQGESRVDQQPAV